MPIHLHLDGDGPLHKALAGKDGVDLLADQMVHIAVQPNATKAGLPVIRMGIIDGKHFIAFAITMREFLSAANAFQARYGDQLGMEKPTESEIAETLPFRVGIACILAQAAKSKAPREELCAFLGDVALTVIETGKIPT